MTSDLAGLAVPIGLGILAWFGVEVVRWQRRPEARRLRALKKIGRRIDHEKFLVVIGTSGSHDYLKDSGDRRYWPVRVAVTPIGTPIGPEGRERPTGDLVDRDGEME